jgi:hypothetical protein
MGYTNEASPLESQIQLLLLCLQVITLATHFRGEIFEEPVVGSMIRIIFFGID